MIATGITVQLITIKESLILALGIALISCYTPVSQGIRDIVHMSVIYIIGYWTAVYLDSTMTTLLTVC